MTQEHQKLYARAHAAIEDLLPGLIGERLTREQWYKALNINPNNPKHIPFKNAVNDVLLKISKNKKPAIVKEGSLFVVPDRTLAPIDFLGARGERFDLILPFGIHNFCFLYRKNVMVLMGSKEAGKTAIMLNIIKDNMTRLRELNRRLVYFSSEMVEDELAGRLAKANGLRLTDWVFEPFERSYDFDQVIDADGANLIDFLELGGDDNQYYKGVSLVRKCYDKLDRGVLIIAVQKNRDADLPKGGSGLLEKARIVLSLDPGKAKLTTAKNWADNVTMSPRGLTWHFQLVGGINLVNIEGPAYEE